jgi:hypothetical protein
LTTLEPCVGRLSAVDYDIDIRDACGHYDIQHAIRTFVIVSLSHVCTLSDVIRDPSRATAQENGRDEIVYEAMDTTTTTIRILVDSTVPLSSRSILRQRPVDQLHYSRHPEGSVIAAACPFMSGWT